MSTKRRICVALAFLAVSGVGAAILWHQQYRLPKRFAIVVEGKLYRSGGLTPRQLEHVAREYGIRTVLSLLDPNAPESVAERAAAARLGLRWVNVPLPGNGASTPEDRKNIKATLFAPDHAPILVHCGAGTNRTGLGVGMYRLHQQGWTAEQVLEEMREFGFEDLPRHQNLRAALMTEYQAARRDPSAATRPVGP